MKEDMVIEDLPGFSLSEFMKKKSDFRILALGVTGSGKTYFLNKLCNRIMKRGLPVLVVDTKAEFGEMSRHRIKNFEPSVMWRQNTWKRKISNMSLDGVLVEEPRLIVEFCAKVVWEIAPAVLYVEEVVESVRKLEQMPHTTPALYKVLQQGRARRASLLVATQRYQQLNDSFIDQASDIFLFYMPSGDIERVEKRFGLKPKTLTFENKYDFWHIPRNTQPIKHYRAI